MTKYRLLWAALILLAVWWFLAPSKTSTNVRLFCAYGRVFIEFEEKYNTWGTTWLDNRGRPVPCEDDSTIKDATNTAETI